MRDTPRIGNAVHSVSPAALLPASGVAAFPDGARRLDPSRPASAGPSASPVRLGAVAVGGRSGPDLTSDAGGPPGRPAEVPVVPEPSTPAAAAAAMGGPVRIGRPRVGSRRDVPANASVRH